LKNLAVLLVTMFRRCPKSGIFLRHNQGVLAAGGIPAAPRVFTKPV